MIELNDILFHPKFESAKKHVDDIAQKINGRICLTEEIPLLIVLKEILGDYFTNYLEIGTFNGGSMSVALQSKFGNNHIGIDIFTYYGKSHDPYDPKQTLVSKNNAAQNISLMNRFNHPVELLEGSSHDPATLAVSSLIDEISLLLIDGDHSFEGVLKDYYLYSPLVSPGGIVAFGTFNNKYWQETTFAVHTIDKAQWHVIGDYKNIFLMQKI